MLPFLKKFSNYPMESLCCDPSVSSGLRVESAPTLKDMYADNYRSSEVRLLTFFLNLIRKFFNNWES